MFWACLPLLQSGFLPVEARFAKRHVALAAEVNGQATFLLLDSGSPETYVRGTPGSVPVRVRVGESQESVLGRATAEFAGLDQPVSGIPVTGLLGCDFLRRGQILLDYRKARLGMRIGTALTDAEATAALGGSGQSISLSEYEGCFRAAADIDGKAAQLVVDTGSDVLALSPKLLGSAGATAKLAGPEGTIEAKLGWVKKLRLGSFTLSQQLAYGFEMPDDGTLGLGVVGDLGPILIDFPGRRLWIRLARS